MLNTSTVNSHYQRLLQGLSTSISTKAYRDVTLTDITSAAKVSRRTFYEHFSDKDDCLLALCKQTSDEMMQAITNAITPQDDWPSIVRHVTNAYLELINSRPTLMRALYIELAALGNEGYRARKKVLEDFAQLLSAQAETHRQSGEQIRDIKHSMAVALIAGVNELILHALMEPDTDVLSVSETAVELIERITIKPAC